VWGFSMNVALCWAEHMAFKGSSRIGTRDFRQEEPLLEAADEVATPSWCHCYCAMRCMYAGDGCDELAHGDFGMEVAAVNMAR
jgi:hypothetical protein